MLEIAYAIVVITALVNFALKFPFIHALRQEAPEIFASFLIPSPAPFGWRLNAARRYFRLIILREYRSRLASCPTAKAWASWLFLVHWIQIAMVALAFIGAAAR